MPASPELMTLTALAQALSRSADLAESLDSALGTVADLLGLETGWVWLLDGETEEPRLAAARSLPPVLRDHPEAMHGDCYCLSTFRAGDLRGAANVNVVWCSRLEKVVGAVAGEGPAATSLRCHASVPLAVGERRLGMLNVASSDWRVLSDDELSLLTTAGALVSLAVERSRLEAAGARAVAAEERNRLAREIHDTLAQGLAGIVAQLQAARTASATGRERHLDTAAELARSTLVEARRSVQALRPEPLEGARLPDALADVAARWAEVSGVPAAVTTTGTPRQLHPEVEIALLRTGQEALANVGKHASASRVGVTLSYMEDVVTLDVRDDGIGFDLAGLPEAVADGSGFGLTGMRQRVGRVAGRLEIESAPGEGTAVCATVPAIPA